MDKQTAIDSLADNTHGIITGERASEVSMALCGEPCGDGGLPVLRRFDDSRFYFKGATIDKPDGYGPWRTGKGSRIERREYEALGITEGIPYCYGVEMEALALSICSRLGLRHESYFGRGSQVKECVRVLREHYNIDGHAPVRYAVTLLDEGAQTSTPLGEVSYPGYAPGSALDAFRAEHDLVSHHGTWGMDGTATAAIESGSVNDIDLSGRTIRAAEVEADDGTSGQDRESYSDEQDRESYTTEADDA
jgi:hypothetical protein